MLAEERGRPLSVAIEGANVHDTKMLAEAIEAIVVERGLYDAFNAPRFVQPADRAAARRRPDR